MFNLVSGREGRPIIIIEEGTYDQWLPNQSEFVRNWLAQSGFDGKKGYRLIPKQDGQLDQVVVAVENPNSVWQLSDLATALPKSSFYLAGEPEKLSAAALGWVLGQYQFTEYKDAEDRATLYIDDDAIVNEVIALAKGVNLTRDLGEYTSGRHDASACIQSDASACQ